MGRAEAQHPEFEQRLVTFSERERVAAEAPDGHAGIFLELLAADTLKVARGRPAGERWCRPAGCWPCSARCAVCAGVLVWMVAARPGFVGYGASLSVDGAAQGSAALL